MLRPTKKERAYKPKRVEVGAKMEDRKRSRDEYHTWRWTKLSRAFRESHPLCEQCRRRGVITPAEVVDHIIPVEVCADFWDQTNWQSLCRKCNIEKGNKDKRMIHNARRGEGGSNLWRAIVQDPIPTLKRARAKLEVLTGLKLRRCLSDGNWKK